MTRPPADDEFTELVHACWGSLYRTAYLMLGDGGEAEELVQTALGETYASWGRCAASRRLRRMPGRRW